VEGKHALVYESGGSLKLALTSLHPTCELYGPTIKVPYPTCCGAVAAAATLADVASKPAVPTTRATNRPRVFIIDNPPDREFRCFVVEIREWSVDVADTRAAFGPVIVVLLGKSGLSRSAVRLVMSVADGTGHEPGHRTGHDADSMQPNG
jgi:hypothetical protein